MTGAVSTIIPATDYNSILSIISPVMGASSQGSTYGYGQTLASSQVASKGVIKAADWQNLYADISNAYAHQTGALPTSTVLPTITKGQTITAAVAALYSSVATTCSTNRMSVAAANLTVTAPTSGSTITRSSTWGSGAAGITAIASLTWSSEAIAAAFFNSGGYITMQLAHPSTASSQDSAWSTFLTGMGTFTFSGTGCTKTGSTGTLTSTAYSVLVTGTPVIVMNKATMTTGGYTANYASVTLTKIPNGFSVTVLLEDNHTNGYYDSVRSGTNAAFGWARATDIAYLATAESAPSFAISTNF